MAKKKADRPIYMVVRKLVDPATGEEVGALVPDGFFNARLMRDRQYRTNDLVRATLKNPRNVKFFRLAHGLGTLIKQNIEGFDKGDSHAALKKLQGDSGVMCEFEEFDVPGLGKLMRKVPRSLSFDDMDESEFRQFYTGICQYLIDTYWHDLTIDEIESMAELLPQQVA